MVRWSSCMLVDSSNSQTTVSLWSFKWRRISRELVERNTDFLDVEDRVAGDFSATTQIGGVCWPAVRSREIRRVRQP